MTASFKQFVYRVPLSIIQLRTPRSLFHCVDRLLRHIVVSAVRIAVKTENTASIVSANSFILILVSDWRDFAPRPLGYENYESLARLIRSIV